MAGEEVWEEPFDEFMMNLVGQAWDAEDWKRLLGADGFAVSGHSRPAALAGGRSHFSAWAKPHVICRGKLAFAGLLC